MGPHQPPSPREKEEPMGKESVREVIGGAVKRSHSDRLNTVTTGPTVTPTPATTSTVLPATAPHRTTTAKSSPRIVQLASLAAPSSRHQPATVTASPRAEFTTATFRTPSDWAVRCENGLLAGASEASDCPSHFTSPARRVHAVVRPYLLLFVFALPFALDAGFAASGTRLQAPLIGSK